MAISVASNFDCGVREPLDKRQVVDTYNDLLAIKTTYDGLECFCKSNQKKYIYYNGGWTENGYEWAKVVSLIDHAVPKGMIVLWSGTTATIPTNWHICDGTEGTIDLRNRFVVGAGGTYNIGDTGGLDSVTLTTAQMPNHQHNASMIGAGGHNHTATIDSAGGHKHTGVTNLDGYHQHHYYKAANVATQTGNKSNEKFGKNESTLTASGEGMHKHAFTTDAVANHNHTITIDAVDAHTHDISINGTGGGEAHENRPPYYALCYIQKIKGEDGSGESSDIEKLISDCLKQAKAYTDEQCTAIAVEVTALQKLSHTQNTDTALATDAVVVNSDNVTINKDTQINGKINNFDFPTTGTRLMSDAESITLDDSVTETSANGVKSSGIYNFVKDIEDTLDRSKLGNVETAEKLYCVNSDKPKLVIYNGNLAYLNRSKSYILSEETTSKTFAAGTKAYKISDGTYLPLGQSVDCILTSIISETEYKLIVCDYILGESQIILALNSTGFDIKTDTITSETEYVDYQSGFMDKVPIYVSVDGNKYIAFYDYGEGALIFELIREYTKINNIIIIDYKIRNFYNASYSQITTDKEITLDIHSIEEVEGINAIYNQWVSDNIKSKLNNVRITGYLEMNSSDANNTSVALGEYTHAEGENSMCWGYNTTASAQYSTAFGNSTTASGENSLAFGNSTTASGENSLAFGNYSTASGENSLAFGNYSTASGENSLAFGDYATAKGNHSIAFNSSTAEGEGSVSFGNSNAKGSRSISFGRESQAQEDYSLAGGRESKTTSPCAVALGSECKANGYASFACCCESIANGYASFACCESIANGEYSNSFGATIALGAYQTTMGRYNIEDTDGIYSFIIGNGTYDNRSNALTLSWDGALKTASTITDGSGNVLSDKLEKSYINELTETEAAAKDWTTATDGLYFVTED